MGKSALLPQLFTIGEAANRLAVSTRTIRRLVKMGELPIVRVAGSVRIALPTLAAYIVSRTEP